ncbi:hypothetical protein BJP40_00075 [Streptomyces sp. CC53]|nr:hypothetical protein BJP40_00075 [Streptomyces sp. CC53]
MPSARATAPAVASVPEVDDLVAVAAALNAGPGSVVYIDSRDMLRALNAQPWTCPNCGGENDTAFAYCPGCGTRKP